jgi:hypothetical protein
MDYCRACIHLSTSLGLMAKEAECLLILRPICEAPVLSWRLPAVIITTEKSDPYNYYFR